MRATEFESLNEEKKRLLQRMPEGVAMGITKIEDNLALAVLIQKAGIRPQVEKILEETSFLFIIDDVGSVHAL